MYAMSCACETVVLYMYLCVGGGVEKEVIIKQKVVRSWLFPGS